jgi:hypothetical protein
MAPVAPTTAAVDQAEHDVVGDQLASVHHCFRLAAQFGTGFHRGAQQITGADVRRAQVPGQFRGLGAFPGPRRTQQHNSHETLPVL